MFDTYPFAEHVRRRSVLRPDRVEMLATVLPDAAAFAERNAAVAEELIASSPKVLIHGDLHSANILTSDTSTCGLVAIDPQPTVGDPAFDVAFLLTASCPAVIDDQRLGEFCDAYQADRKRARQWVSVLAGDFAVTLLQLFPNRHKELRNLVSLLGA